jgi:hypothetical protein
MATDEVNRFTMEIGVDATTAPEDVKTFTKSVESLKIELEEVSGPLDKSTAKIKAEGEAAEKTAAQLTGLAAAQKRFQDEANAASSAASSGKSSGGSGGTGTFGGGSDWEAQLAREEEARRAARERDSASVLTNYSKQNQLTDQLEKQRTTSEVSEHASRLAATDSLEKQRATSELKTDSEIFQGKVRYAQMRQGLIEGEIKATQSGITRIGAEKAKEAEKDLAGIAMRGRIQAQVFEQAALKGAVSLKGGAVHVADFTRKAEKLGQASAVAGIDLTKLGRAGIQAGYGLRQIGRGDVGGVIAGIAHEGMALKNVLGVVSGASIATGGAIGAMVLAVLGAGAALVTADFLAVKASQSWGSFGDKLYVAQQKSRLTVDQLELLYVIGARTNTSFEHLTNTASRLQVSIGKALSEPTNNAAKQIKALGIELKELGQQTPTQQLILVATALDKTKNEAVRAQAAQILLQRGWLEAATSIHELATNAEEAREIMNALGLNMEQNQVDAAHKFEMQLRTLGLAAEAFAITVGEKTAPEVVRAFNEISKTLGINANNWREWGEAVGTTLARVLRKQSEWVDENRKSMQSTATNIYNVAGAIANLYELIQRLNPLILTVRIVRTITDQMGPEAQAATTGTLKTFIPGIPIAEKILDWVKPGPRPQKLEGEAFTRGTRGINPPPQEVFPTLPTDKKKKGGGGKGMDPARAAKELADQILKAELAGYKSTEEALKFSLDQRYISLENFTQQAEDLEFKRHDAVIKAYEDEIKQLEVKPMKDPLKQKIELGKINAQIEEENQKSSEKMRQLELARDRDRLTSAQAHRQAILRIKETGNSNMLALDKVAAEVGITTLETAAKREEEIIKSTYKKDREELDKQIAEAREDASLIRKLEDDKLQLRVKYSGDLQRITFQQIEDRKKDGEAWLQYGITLRKIFSDVTGIQAETRSLEIAGLEATNLHRTAAIKLREQEEISAIKRTSKESIAAVEDEMAKIGAEYKKNFDLAVELDRVEKFQKSENAKNLLAQLRALSEEKIELEKNTQAKINEAARKSQQQQLEHWRDIASEISDTLINGVEQGWQGILEDTKRFLGQLERELLQSLLMMILRPGSPQQGSPSGGIVGDILNRIFKIGQPSSPTNLPTNNTTAKGVLDTILGQNTDAISANTGAVGSSTSQIATSIIQTGAAIVAEGLNTGVTTANTLLTATNTAALGSLEVTIWDLELAIFNLTAAIETAGIPTGDGASGASGLISSLLGSFTGHAGGLDYVPYDNYPAFLHKGEAVITASENRSGRDGNVIINLPPRTRNSYQSPVSDRVQAEAIAAAIKSRLRGN